MVTDWSREAVVVVFLGRTRCSGLAGALIYLDRSPTQQCDVAASSASPGNVLTVDAVTRLGCLRSAGTFDYRALHLGRYVALCHCSLGRFRSGSACSGESVDINHQVGGSECEPTHLATGTSLRENSICCDIAAAVIHIRC